MPSAPSLPAAVGAFVAQMREEHELTFDQIARTARQFGANWSASSVRNIERGQATLTLPTLMHLALALSGPAGRPLRLIDLLGDAKTVAFGRGIDLTREAFERALSGEPVTLTPDDLSEVQHHRKEVGGQPASLAEQRAAHKLGIDAPRLQRLALELWQKPLEDEARRRAGEGSTPQARGRVTRLLLDEIRQHL